MSALNRQARRSRPGMGFRSDGTPIVAPALWRSVLRRFLRQPEPVAGIPGEGSGAGEHSAPAPYRLFPEPGDGVIYWSARGPWHRLTVGSDGSFWAGPIPVDVPARSILFPGEGSGAGEQSAPAPAPTFGVWNAPDIVALSRTLDRILYTNSLRGPVPVDVPARSILFPREGEGVGIPCATCGRRGTVRIKPRIYGCRHCLGLSLVAIGRMGTCGFAVYELRETPAEAAALQAAIARGTVER